MKNNPKVALKEKVARKKSITSVILFKEIAKETDLKLPLVKQIVTSFFYKTALEIAKGERVALIGWMKAFSKKMKDKVRSPISGEEVSPKMKFGVKIKAGAKMIKVVNGIKINGQKPKAKKSIAVKKNKKVSK